MVGCRRCGGRRYTASSSLPLPSNQAQNSLMSNEFIKMVYIGESGIVPSVLDELSYNRRETGSVMFVHQKDLEARPDLWTQITDTP